MQQWGQRQPRLQLTPMSGFRHDGSSQRKAQAQDRLLSSWFPTIILLYSFCCSSLNVSFTFSLFRPPSLMRERLCVIAKISCPLASQPDAQDCSKTKKNLPETKVLQSSLIRMSSETSPGLLESTLSISKFSLVPWIRIHYLFEVLCNCLNLLRSLKFFLNIHSHLTKDKGGISGLMEGKLSFKKY